ncbi:aminotransferase class III-fold pyridoxal phosphate-dependent enzyme [Streptomyces sp. NBC_00075]|uniref:aminotransferase family protein n=1 Tax=Streptomyces sp. NBC_00075 TaxID=2975641 RepID=UPI00324CEC1A
MRSTLIQNVLDAELPAIESASGVWLTDTEGRRYFDACSGAVVTTIGHAHPHVVRAIAEQAAKVTFTHRGAFTSTATDALADRLTAMTGYAGAWFVNSGSEATEAAMQFALQYFRETGRPERQWFLSHRKGYHGNTLGGLSLSGHARRGVAGELAHDFPVLTAPYAFRDAPGLTDAEYSAVLLGDARRRFEEHGGTLAAVVVEAVGGATLGCTTPPDGYLQGLRALCDEFGVLMIVDEVMTGAGRTGTMLAVDHWDVRPDIVALGKGLAAGYSPMAATLVNERVLGAIREGSGRIHGGHTYAGNPLSIATGMAVLDVLENEKVIERAAALAPVFQAHMERVASVHPSIVDVRGIGMMRAFEFELTDGRQRATGALAARFAAISQHEGAIVYATTGGYNDAVSVAPPLVATETELDELFDIIDRALTVFETELGIGVPVLEGTVS